MKLTSIITDYIARTILTVNGDILTRVAGVLTRFGIGTDGQVLRVNVAATAVEWGDPNTIDDVAGLTLKCKVVDIGDWNMVAASVVTPNHSLTYADIISVDGYVRRDDDLVRHRICSGINGGTNLGDVYISEWTATQVILRRLVGGSYDDPLYDSTGYNRGKLFIWYLA
jgi:hypothetical protein